MALGGETSQTLDRGIRVLELLAASGSRGMSISELAAGLDVGRPVVYRLLATLIEHNLVRRFDDGQLRVSLGLLPLAAAAHGGMRQIAQPILRDLANRVGATAHLTVADGDEAIAVAVEEPRWTDFHVSYRVGSVHPVTRGAAGKAIVAGRQGHDSLVESIGELQDGARGYAVPLLGIEGVEASVGVVTVDAVNTGEVGAHVRWAAAAIAEILT
jgi:DNA-binding IclR family transcriptional regulator